MNAEPSAPSAASSKPTPQALDASDHATYREHGPDGEIDADGLHWPDPTSLQAFNAREVHDLSISIIEAYDDEHSNTYCSRMVFISLAHRLKGKLPSDVFIRLLGDAIKGTPK